jgi:hypothetical protein
MSYLLLRVRFFHVYLNPVSGHLTFDSSIAWPRKKENPDNPNKDIRNLNVQDSNPLYQQAIIESNKCPEFYLMHLINQKEFIV